MLPKCGLYPYLGTRELSRLAAHQAVRKMGRSLFSLSSLEFMSCLPPSTLSTCFLKPSRDSRLNHMSKGMGWRQLALNPFKDILVTEVPSHICLLLMLMATLHNSRGASW